LSILQRKLKAARHDANDGISFAIEVDGLAEDICIALKAIHPQGIADYGQRLMSVVFLGSKHATQHRLGTKRGKHIGCDSGSRYVFRPGDA